MTQGKSGALAIFWGFVPWIAYWNLGGFGLPFWGAFLGAVFCVGLLVYRRGEPRWLETVSLGYFLGVMAYVALGHDMPRLLQVISGFSALAIMAFTSLLRRESYTAEYIKADYPHYKDHPLFAHVNRLITALWGVIFAFGAGAAALGFGEIPGHVATGLGIFLSFWGPSWAVKRHLGARIRENTPYDWPVPDFPHPPASESHDHDVIVVGAGIGGLTAGALLAKRGLKVLVAEQWARPGGFCHAWLRRIGERDGKTLRIHCDGGVHDISGAHPGGTVDSLLRRLEVADQVTWLPMPQRYLLAGGEIFDVPVGGNAMAAAVAARFPQDAAGIHKLFEVMAEVYDALYLGARTNGGVPHRPRSVDEMMAFPQLFPRGVAWMDRPFGEILDSYLSDPTAKTFLSTLTGYLSDKPEDLTVGAMAPIFGYYYFGGHYPKGGSQTLADVLVSVIRAHGGRVILGKGAVSRILVREGAVVGVRLKSGEEHKAPAVISNADLRRTVTELLGKNDLPQDFVQSVTNSPYSTSAFSVYLALDMVPDLPPLTFLRPEGDAPGMLIAIPCRADPDLAPPGMAGVELLTFLPNETFPEWDRTAPDYAARKREMGDRLVAAAARAIPQIHDHIVYREEASPATYERYAWTHNGAIYGPAATGFRAPIKSPIRGLCFAGAGSWAGPGVEAVVITGVEAADALCPPSKEELARALPTPTVSDRVGPSV